jgi:hypothetical protein
MYTDGVTGFGKVCSAMFGTYPSWFFGGAGNLTTTAGFNVGIGPYALAATTDGGSNVAIGPTALQASTSGDQNIAVGCMALSAVTTGRQNVAVGYQAGQNMTTGSRSVAIGYSALQNADAQNIAIGYNAGLQLTTGDNNIIIGNSAGQNLATGRANTIVGPTNTGVLPAALSNSIILSDGDANIRADFNFTTPGTWTLASGIAVNHIYNTPVPMPPTTSVASSTGPPQPTLSPLVPRLLELV